MNRMSIGDKVVCVDDSPCKTCGANLSIVKGSIYVIVGLRLSRYGSIPMLDLLGAEAACHGEKNNGYMAARFRLLDEMKHRTRSEKCQAGS